MSDVLTGRVVRFDAGRGFGFIAPDKGGEEDVFVHVNGLVEGKQDLRVGTRVSFQVVGGKRGLKAYDVRVVDPGDSTPESEQGAARAEQAPSWIADFSESCEVLTRAELTTEVTEALLKEVQSLTAAQVLQVREVVLRLADGHDWLID
ncbi:cold-shock protein [Lentzea flava]|uniref:DNA-binding protein n=1 Tax=Lentzea flava TaxID=103732 RepID=A0ABQ2VAA6_9PSEU|nr:cold shock domain-containing protein [Lentzea flava]MCP2204342.1 Cold shock protein, CspA family [Lentzea flava]GGU76816.1 DNA-binding protein [Lentzea flava]